MDFNPNDYNVSQRYNPTSITSNQQFITETIQHMEEFKDRHLSPSVTRQLLFVDEQDDEPNRVHNGNIYNPNAKINVVVKKNKSKQRPFSAAASRPANGTRSNNTEISNKAKAYYWNHKYEEEQKHIMEKENIDSHNSNIVIPKLNLTSSSNRAKKHKHKRPQSAAAVRHNNPNGTNMNKYNNHEKKKVLGPWERSATALKATKARLEYKENTLGHHHNIMARKDVHSIPKANARVSKLSQPRQVRRKFVEEERMKTLGFQHPAEFQKIKRKRPLSAAQRKKLEEKQRRLSQMAQPRFKREKFTSYNGPGGNKDLKPATKAMKLANELMERVSKYDKFMDSMKHKTSGKRPSSAPARRAKGGAKCGGAKSSNKQFNLSSTDAAEKHVKRCIKRREQKVKDFYMFIKSLSDAKHGLMKMPNPTITIDSFENLIGEIQILTLEVVASIESWRKQLLEKKTLNRFNVSANEYVNPPPFLWKIKQGCHNVNREQSANEHGEVNYLVHITSSLDFLAQSNTTHFNRGKIEENDETTIDFKGIVLSLKPKLALMRNPFLLTTDALWGDRAPFFTAERVILDEERRVYKNGNHGGHFVSFVSSNTHNSRNYPGKKPKRIKSKMVEKYTYHKDDHRYSPSNSSAASSNKSTSRESSPRRSPTSTCRSSEHDDETPRDFDHRGHHYHHHNHANSETMSNHQPSLIGLQSSRSAISAPNDALSLYEHKHQVTSSSNNNKNPGTPSDVKIQRLSRTVEDLKDQLLFVQSQAQYQERLNSTGIGGNNIVARNASPPSMSKVFQLCQVALGHIDLIGKDETEMQIIRQKKQMENQQSQVMPQLEHAIAKQQAKDEIHHSHTLHPSHHKLRHSLPQEKKNHIGRQKHATPKHHKHNNHHRRSMLPSPPSGPPPQRSLDDFVKRRQNIVKIMRRHGMAVKIQTLYRQYIAKKKLRHLKERHQYHMKILEEAYQHAMARNIIRRFVLKAARQRIFKKQWLKSITIQKWYLRIAQKYCLQVQIPAAITLQSYARMMLCKNRVEKMRLLNNVVRIQNTYRSHKAREFLNVLKEQKRKHYASICVQCAYRQYKARNTVMKLRMDQYCSTPRRVNLVHPSNKHTNRKTNVCTKIQRHMRRAFSMEEKLKLLEKAKSPPGGYRPKLAGANSPNESNRQAGNRKLLAACRDGDTDLVREYLYRDHMDAKLCNERGETPLHFACAGGYEMIVQMLLDKDANVNAADTIGRLPLHVAVEHGQETVAKILLQNKAQVNAMA